MKKKSSRRTLGYLSAVVSAGLSLLVSSAGFAQTNRDNDRLEREIIGLNTVNLVSTIGSLAPPPPGLYFEATALVSNIALKNQPASLAAPTSGPFQPNAENNCVRQFTLPQSHFVYANMHGLLDISPVKARIGGVERTLFFGYPEDWGGLGKPDIFHLNADVFMTVKSPYIVSHDLPTLLKNPFLFQQSQDQTVNLPAGYHRVEWETGTLIDPFFDIAVPTAFLAYNYRQYKAKKLAAATAGNSAKAAKELSVFQKIMAALADTPALKRAAAKYATKKGATFLGDYLTNFEGVAGKHAVHRRYQDLIVYDVHDPVISVGTPNLVVEASDFGGVLLNRVSDQLRADVTATDECNGILPNSPGEYRRVPSLFNDAPPLLPLGDNVVTWTAVDQGPNINLEGNRVTAQQTITVQDTQAPIMVPPPGKVIEVDPADTDGSDGISGSGVDSNIVSLGVPLVVDLADPTPIVTSDAPAFFETNSRTEVVWSATDHGFPSANTTTASQLITVKELGQNTAPVVADVQTTTLTSMPIDIVLTGVDNDMLDGRVDPLGFKITSRPSSGEFVAPLFPYFIEDYRTKPSSDLGEEFLTTNNKNNYLYDRYCRNGLEIPIDWVYAPKFAQVTDEGTQFMLDTYWKCNPSDASGGGQRISKWDSDGNFLDQIDYPGTNNAFVMDQDGFIYTLSKNGAGSSTTLSVSRLKPNFDEFSGSASDDFWRFTFASTGNDPVSNSQYSYARVDSKRGLIYVNDRRRIFVFDVRADLADPARNSNNGMDDRYLGALNNAEQVIYCSSGSSSWTGFAMEVDSEGGLYVIDTCGDRIHKFAPSGFDENDNFVAGEYLGWMGRCETSTNKACDEVNQISRGYTCTDQTCTFSSTEGDQRGQFSQPLYATVDPNDVLYVADNGNARIQRFAPDGTYAGEAVSTGTGINNGESPGFMLGNMGNPRSVSVNSTQFLVVDTDESFVHVFETSPFKNISDSSVTVSYVSRFDFHSATDVFEYEASDGLATSNIGTVSVQVDRNHRAPESFAIEATTDEDNSVDVELMGDDPDGILGVDVFGLDTLTYRVVDHPLNGSLSGSAENRTYQPNPDFYGEDRFNYVTNDGEFDSEPSEVVITVVPVDDPPEALALNLPERVGAGFPIIASAEFQDDGAAAHDVMLDWGDQTEFTGDFVDPDGEGPEPAALEGIKILDPEGGDGVGSALGRHMYTSTGPENLTFCIGDDQERQHCVAAELEVESLVNMNIETSVSIEEITTETTELDVVITNLLPEGVPGLTAENVYVSQDRSSVLNISSLVEAPEECAFTTGQVYCDLGSMAPGESILLRLLASSREDVIHDTSERVEFKVVTSTKGLQDDYRAFADVRVIADPTDTDNDGMSDAFENAYGLDPLSSDDLLGDPDGDGLTNFEEFEQQTNPLRGDTDADGLTDGAELSAGTDPTERDSDGDGMFDRWELDNGLDPLIALDAFYDVDGDGAINLLEFLNGSDITLADTDGDGRLDGQDSNPVVALDPRLAQQTIVETLLLD